jgi:hypothetical protein
MWLARARYRRILCRPRSCTLINSERERAAHIYGRGLFICRVCCRLSKWTFFARLLRRRRVPCTQQIISLSAEGLRRRCCCRSKRQYATRFRPASRNNSAVGEKFLHTTSCLTMCPDQGFQPNKELMITKKVLKQLTRREQQR